jgi:aspartate/methionine/tyrosine aminotransferase
MAAQKSKTAAKRTCEGHANGANLRPHSIGTGKLHTSRRSAIEPFHAMDVLAEANRLAALGKPVISMAVGQPSDPAPLAVRGAAKAALDNGRIGYTNALGLESLRLRIARHYREQYGLEISHERIAVTTGSSSGFNLAFLAMFDAGDRVAITRPGYPAYRNIMAALGIEVVELPIGAGEGELTGERLAEIHARTPLKGLLFASPANPTGASLQPDVLKHLVLMARELGISVISDEIYHRLSYAGGDITALSVSDEVTVINSFSKYYCMTGWRIGWMVLPPSLVRAVERIAQNLYISAPELSQIAAIEAFDAAPELEQVKGRYAQNRQILASQLPKLGFELAANMDGAFYAWCDVSRHTNDSMAFARKILSQTFVAATPGHDFDPVNGHRFMRFSYAGSPKDMAEAMARLKAWV